MSQSEKTVTQANEKTPETSTEQPTTTHTEPPSKSSSTPKSGNQSSGLRAVGIVGSATILSRILGLIRDMVFATLFSRAATDAFAVAFTIPNILRRLLAEGIISTAFIPVFAGVEKRKKEDKLKTYGAVLGVFSFILVLVTVAGVLLSPWLAKAFAPGFSGERLTLATYLTGLMFPFLLLVGLASFWIAILQTRKHFAAPALGPVMLNIGIISCAFLLSRFFPGNRAITAMAIGVLVGGLLQLGLQITALSRQKMNIRPRWEPSDPAIKEILILMAPTLLGLGVYQFNIMVSRMFGSLLPQGSLTYLYISDRLMELPLGVIAVAFATVNLPTLARQAEAKSWFEFRGTLTSGIRNVLFFCVPAAFGLFALREPIISLLFQRGRFTYQEVLSCSHIFVPAAFGLIFVAALRNLTPGFYAYKDTKTPVKIAFASLVINVALSGLFAFALGMKAQGLTLANACSAAIAVILSLSLLNKKLSFSKEELAFLWLQFPRLLFAGGLMCAVLIAGNAMVPWQTLHLLLKMFYLGGLIMGGSAIYFFATSILKIEESKMFLQKLNRVAKRLVGSKI